MMRTSRGGVWGWLDRRAVERLLGARLPDHARNVRYVDWQPSGDLAYHEALIRFELALEPYRQWLAGSRLPVLAAGELPPEGPAIWRAPPELSAPPWWTPSSDMTLDTAQRRVGGYGSLIVKWENGSVFAHLIDTGHCASDTRPSST